jgi:hypothetical protein
MARHRADTSPVLKRRVSLSLAVLVGAPLLALGPVSAATAADATTAVRSAQEISTQKATVSVEDAPANALLDLAAAAGADKDTAPVDPIPTPVDPAPVDPNSTPVDPDPLPADPDPLPLDPTPTPVDPKPVDPNPLPLDPTPTPVDPKPVDSTPPSMPASPTPAYAAPEHPRPLRNDPVVPSAVVGGVSTQVGQLPARVVGGATEAAAVSRVPAQTLPAEQLAATGASDSNLALSGVGLVSAGAAALMLCGRGRRAATA